MREPKVTRTITTTIALLLCVNPETKEVFDKEVRLPGRFDRFKDSKRFNKALEKATANETYKVASVISTRDEKSLHVMSEEKFIANSDILPCRKTTKKTEKEK